MAQLRAASQTIVPTGVSPAGDVFLEIEEAAYVWDVPSDRLDWTSNAHAVLGLEPGVAIDTAAGFAALFDPEALTTRREAVFGSLKPDAGDGVLFEVEYPLMRGARSARLWVQDRGRWRAGPDGRPARVVGAVRRLGARYETAEQAATLARFDPLTGQLSRARLIEVAAAALSSAVRLQNATCFALASLTNLRPINEAYGLDVGDQVIVEVSRRLRGAMRGGDTLGRFSTSTFGMVLQECERNDLEVVARRLTSAVHDQPVMTPAGPVAVRIAVGSVVAPRHARDSAELVARARTSLAIAADTTSGFNIYAPNPQRDAERRASMRLADELVSALAERRVVLAFQPVVSAATGQVCWSEALARVVTAEGEVVSGGPLAAAAEQVGLIHMLDRRVLDLAIKHLADRPDARVAINVSATTTADESWADAMAAWFALRPDVAQRLMVEITETAAIADIKVTARFVEGLRASGVRVAIDDFGTGHSSFKALRELAVDLVKIDGSFVRDLDTSPDSRAFARALVALARELGFETVAEQVETETAAAQLKEWGVTYLQGDRYGPPALA